MARGMYPGSACTGSGRGLCYESSIGTLECGRTIETWSNLGRGPEDAFVVNTAPKIWNGTELVTITHELLHSLVPVEPKPTLTIKKKPKNVTLGCTLKEMGVGEEEEAAAE